jgi:hypothetical protein
MRLAALLVLALLGCGTAIAQDVAPRPFKATDYPIEVRKALSGAVIRCREGDDGKVTFAPDTVRKVDLTGDGRDDFIISYRNTKCSSFPFIYCGTGGCGLDIFVALSNGRYRKVFSNNVRGYEILPGKGGRTIRFDVHGGYCDTYGPAECQKKRRITEKPFTFGN